MKILLLYHFMSPDNVVSATHMHQLGQFLFENGYQVDAWPSNRSRHQKKTYRKKEVIGGIHYDRINRLNITQDQVIFRLINSFSIITAWLLRLAIFKKNYNVIIIGTDPLFSPVIIPLIKLLRHKTKIILWNFDQHPDGIIAINPNFKNRVLCKILSHLTMLGIKKSDLVVSMGPCMSDLLKKKYSAHKIVEIPPWSIIEYNEYKKVINTGREKYFKPNTLGIMYSGNFGLAHDLNRVLGLVKYFQDSKYISFCFSVNENQIKKLSDVFARFKNVTIIPKTTEASFSDRLWSADIHLSCLKHSFKGISVPSKVIGSFCHSRPVIYLGNVGDSSAVWIEKFQLGICNYDDDFQKIENYLESIHSSNLNLLYKKIKIVYDEYFSKRAGLSRLLSELKILTSQG